MEVLDQTLENRLSKRYLAIKNLEYYIEESVYYRSFSEDMVPENRKVLYNLNDSEGKLEIK